MKKIVVTKNLNFYPDQLTRLKSLWDVVVYENEPESWQEWVERCKDANIICTWMMGFKSKELYSLSDIFISLPFVGIEYLDIPKLKEKNIIVANSPWCNKEAVVEWIIWMMLMTQRNLLNLCNTQSDQRNDILKTGKTLYDKKITILGKWNIGKHLATICEVFWMHVTFFERWNDLISSIQDSDIIVNCLNITNKTTWILDKNFFHSIKKWALFISPTRHQSYDIQALKIALERGTLTAAIDDAADARVWDVYETIYQELLTYPNMYVTPHIAWNSEVETRKANDIMIENIEAYLRGKPQNLIY